jgi:hypothetical protein
MSEETKPAEEPKPVTGGDTLVTHRELALVSARVDDLQADISAAVGQLTELQAEADKHKARILEATAELETHDVPGVEDLARKVESLAMSLGRVAREAGGSRAIGPHGVVGEIVHFTVPESLKCRPALVLEVFEPGDDKPPTATLHIFRMPEDTAFVHQNIVEKAPMHYGSEHPAGGTWHER